MIRDPKYDIVISAGAISELSKYVAEASPKSERVMVVTDSNVAPLYLKKTFEQLKLTGKMPFSHIIEAGEKSKTAENYLGIIADLAKYKFRRSDAVLALGGGVVGDMAGFAAATYMRGIDLIHLPTSLLAMIDSSIGGKTGVDLPEGKNLLGAFYYPKIVIIDTNFLKTLERKEWLNAIGEGIKYVCLIGDEAEEALLDVGSDPEKFVRLCAKYKSDITSKDMREGGLRRLLNLGHTVGHALESASGYALPHGTAVAYGVAVMARAALNAGELDKDDFKRIYSLLRRFDLLPQKIDMNSVAERLASDKKASGKDRISAVKIFGLGDCRIEEMSFDDFIGYISNFDSVKALPNAGIEGSVRIPPSKSEAHRTLIATALAGGELKATGGDDITRTYSALCKIMSAKKNDVLKLNVGESGSTFRLLLPIIGALGLSAEFNLEGRLKDRPIEGLKSALEEHGMSFDGLRVSGQLRGGDIKIDATTSSQYISGLLFALPLLKEDSRIILVGKPVSESYINMTTDTLRRFGISVESVPCGYYIKGGQSYKSPDKIEVGGDWSSALFIIGAALLNGDVKLLGLDKNSIQGDKIVYNLLKNAGADMHFEGDELCVKRSKLSAVSYDAADCPDTVPAMATLMAFADGVSHITSVDRLSLKESDRLRAVMELIGRMGVKCEYQKDELIIYGGSPKGGNFDGYGDHRIAMSAVMAALKAEGESTVSGVSCIAKSYPQFLDTLRALGAEIL